MTQSVEVDNTTGVGTDRKKVYNVPWKMTQNLKVRHNTLDVDTDCERSIVSSTMTYSDRGRRRHPSDADRL